ncbi:hypothetical protein H6504_01185 [Candidatus Woesearchaeota archaeon]|nr:hypothetical protein [Candidatus Woesearchaeota archaeon]
MRRKVYGENKLDTCQFCDKTATVQNAQGVPTCITHTQKLLDDKKCVCGEWMPVKTGKWGAFFLCPTCGPTSIKKAESMDNKGYKLNKSFREKQTPKKEKVYTLDELERLWD